LICKHISLVDNDILSLYHSKRKKLCPRPQSKVRSKSKDFFTISNINSMLMKCFEDGLSKFPVLEYVWLQLMWSFQTSLKHTQISTHVKQEYISAQQGSLYWQFRKLDHQGWKLRWDIVSINIYHLISMLHIKEVYIRFLTKITHPNFRVG